MYPLLNRENPPAGPGSSGADPIPPTPLCRWQKLLVALFLSLPAFLLFLFQNLLEKCNRSRLAEVSMEVCAVEGEAGAGERGDER